MKNKFKSLIALWLVLILSFTMIIPLGAADSADIPVYVGNEQPYAGMGLPYNDITKLEYTAGDKLDEAFADYIPEYWELTGWERWSATSGTLDYQEAVYNKDKTISADELDTWYEDVLFPIHNDLRAITKQPTANDPTVEVNYPDNATYQWHKKIDGNTKSSFTELTPSSPHFNSYCCGDYLDGNIWGYHFNNEVDIWFALPSDYVVKITLLSDDDNFLSNVFDYNAVVEFAYNEADNAWYSEKASSDITINPEIHGSAPFTAEIELIKGSTSTSITYNECYTVYDGTYDFALEHWDSYNYPDSYFLDIDFHIQDISAGTIIKVTPESDDANFELDFDSWHDYDTYEIDGVYYLEYTSDYDPGDDNIYFYGSAPFTAKIEITSPILVGETSQALSEIQPGVEYYCVITWPDGFSLTSESFFSSSSVDKNANAFYLPVLLLMKRMRYYDGDEMVGWQRITGGEILEPLTLDDKDGMTLEGWYIDKKLTEKFDFTLPVKYGIKLYAKWIEAPVEEAPDEEVPADDELPNEEAPTDEEIPDETTEAEEITE